MSIRSVAVMLACAASILRWAGPTPMLRVYGESGILHASIPVQDGFTITFVHSVNLSPVDEEFVANDDGSITLVRERFDQLSTGMPSGDEDGFAIENARFVTRPNRRFPEIAIRVSPVAGHMLRTGNRERPLTYWAPVSGLLVFSAAEKSGYRAQKSIQNDLSFSDSPRSPTDE